jgi:hypothetical protein
MFLSREQLIRRNCRKLLEVLAAIGLEVAFTASLLLAFMSTVG